MKRIKAHLIEAHNFTPDSPRLNEPDVTHDWDHASEHFMHLIDDFYLAVEDSDDTSDPDEEVDA